MRQGVRTLVFNLVTLQVMQQIKPHMMEYAAESIFMYTTYSRGGCRCAFIIMVIFIFMFTHSLCHPFVLYVSFLNTNSLEGASVRTPEFHLALTYTDYASVDATSLQSAQPNSKRHLICSRNPLLEVKHQVYRWCFCWDHAGMLRTHPFVLLGPTDQLFTMGMQPLPTVSA